MLPTRSWSCTKSSSATRSSRVVHGVKGSHDGRTSMPASRRIVTVRAASAAVCPLSRRSSTASSTDSNAETTNTQPDAANSGHSAAWRSTCSTFTVQSKVTSGKRSCNAATMRARVRGCVEEVGISERDVFGAGGHELGDVGEHRVLVDPAHPSVEHHRDRAVAAAVRAPVGREDRTDEPLFTAGVEARVAVERREQSAVRESCIPLHRGREVLALRRVEAERPHGTVDAVCEIAGEPGRGVHGHRERHLVGPLDHRGIPRIDRHVERPHLVAALLEVGRRLPSAPGCWPSS